MRRWLVVLLVASLLGACSRAAPAQPPETGSPEAPATVTADGDAAPLPASGAVGRGALLLRDAYGQTVLVLEDGRQLRLPDGPEGEWWGRKISATLSPDGWWLGLRAASGAGDQGYQVRSLATGETYAAVGTPRAWSHDSRWLLLATEHLPYLDHVPETYDEETSTLMDLTTGDSRVVDPVTGHADTILASGEGLIMSGGSTEVALLEAGGARTTIPLGTDDDACWCPSTDPVLSPDGTRISVVLASRPAPGSYTSGPTPPPSPGPEPPREFVRIVAVFDRATGAEISRTAFVLPANPDLLADRGQEVLVRVRTDQGNDQIMALDPVSGAQRVVTSGPAGWSVIIPGEAPPPLYPGGFPV